MQAPEVVVSKVKPVCWTYVVGLAVFALLSPIFLWFDKSTPHSAKLIISGIVLAGPGLLAVFGAFVNLRHHIIADANGLEWFSFTRMRRVTWAQVREYYWVEGKENVNGVVVTDLGKISLEKTGTNMPQLRAAIAERALWAHAREWGPYGDMVQPDEIKTFRYGKFIPWMAVVGVLQFGLLPPMIIMGGGSLQNPFSNLQAGLAIMPPLLVITPYVIWCLLWLAICAIAPLLIWPVYFAIRPRMDDSIETSEEGIRWTSGADSIFAKWDEIQAYRMEHLPGPIKIDGHRVVETRRGNFSFIMMALDQGHVLDSIIRKQVQPVASAPRQDFDEPPSEVLPDGSKLFNYRIPMNRAMLWFAMIFTGQPAFCAVLASYGLLPPLSGGSFWGIGFSCVFWLACIYGWLAYYYSQIKIGEAGLEYTNVRGQTVVRWDEVTAIGWTDFSSTIRTANRTLRFGILGNRSSLMQEIHRRAPQAEILDWPASEKLD